MRRFATSLPALTASILAAILLAIAGRAGADCPQSTILFGGLEPANPIPKVAPRCDTTFSIQPCDRVHGRYDLPAGLLIASIDLACQDAPGLPGPSGLETVVEDDFHLVGQNSGLPVIFIAVLHLSGEGHNFGAPGGSGGARVRGTIAIDMGGNASFQHSTSANERDFLVNEPLTLQVGIIPGASTHLRFAVRAEAFEGRGRLDGLIEFTGLPVGVSVGSCRGYLSAAPVAARKTSWGRLKASYR